MTFSVRHVVGILKLRAAALATTDKSSTFRPPQGWFGTENSILGDWGPVGDQLYKYVWGCHVGHLLEFATACVCYVLLYCNGDLLREATTWQISWIAQIVGFNLACMVVITSFWHWFVLGNKVNSTALKPYKFNPVNQYEPESGQAGMFMSSTGNLQREITFSTLGWLQSSFWQVLYTHLWAIGYLNVPDMSKDSGYIYTVALLAFVTYWREIHFYFVHRGMHPWFARERGLLDGDVGAFLYRHFHSLHHKSYNPGPWSGLCMHPVEHFFYYSCATLLPLVLPRVHPLVFLYCKFHCDISPLAGHDGYDDPGGNGAHHWLHHAKFECNYGGPFPINWDRIFGTWQDYKEYKANGDRLNMGSKRAMEETRRAIEALDCCGKEESLLAGQATNPERLLSMEQVAVHNSAADCWVVLQGRVLDVTGFLPQHPGGEQEILSRAGKDVTRAWLAIHREGMKLLDKWPVVHQVGLLATPP